MERIKKFTAFFENVKTQKSGKNSNVCIMKLSNDEAYGTPTLVYNKYDSSEIKNNAVGIREIWGRYIAASYGPIYGPDCFHHLTDSIEDYINSESEEDKEENLSSVNFWMDHLEIKDHSAEDLINDSDLVEEYLNKYLIPVRKHFESIPYWNYIVISTQKIKASEEIPLELEWTTLKSIYEALESDFGKDIEVFAYNGDDDYIYYFSKQPRDETKEHLISTGIKRKNYKGLASLICETDLAGEAEFITGIPLDIAEEVYKLKGWDLEELYKLRDLGNLGFF